MVYEECSSVFISSETQNLDQIKISLIGQLKEAAMTLMEEGEYWRAETIYNLMLKVEEDASDVILGLVESMLSQNKFEEAEKCLAEGLERNPKAEELREKEEEFRQGEIRDYRDRILKSTWYKEDGNISSYTISEYNDKDGSSKTTFYDSKGNMKNEEYTFYENNGKKRKVRYDATGYLMSESGYTEEGIWRTIAYNEDGTVKYIEDQMDSGERKTYDSDGNLKFYTVREYDEAGRCIKWSEYSSDDELRGYWVSEYDDQGNRISYRQYNPDGTLDAYLEAE